MRQIMLAQPRMAQGVESSTRPTTGSLAPTADSCATELPTAMDLNSVKVLELKDRQIVSSGSSQLDQDQNPNKPIVYHLERLHHKHHNQQPLQTQSPRSVHQNATSRRSTKSQPQIRLSLVDLRRIPRVVGPLRTPPRPALQMVSRPRLSSRIPRTHQQEHLLLHRSNRHLPMQNKAQRQNQHRIYQMAATKHQQRQRQAKMIKNCPSKTWG